MPGRITRSRSSESPDPGDTMLEADKIIRKLKKEREDNIGAVMAESNAALTELREKAASWQRDLQQQRQKRRLDCITRLIELEDRKGAIEDKMGSISAKAHATVEELEAMLMAGYEGREKDAAIALERIAGKRES
ncbi:hypothetical protein BBK36DRAFT_8042 [Trichoderma citrinoviride]|uniref:Uncharacterized protein n=1 Tax=Trichoderma citrinoviride TaxID=58853 RepID=A0A2T4B0U2_9HYPO|nr:hypothetical protein BBK36DRAFT_8042 [Trichoderma citrinoviride]PTB62943.1 hypothetical protein BBK36DRAFT_8042 [Trichoderma citrinoviride]